MARLDKADRIDSYLAEVQFGEVVVEDSLECIVSSIVQNHSLNILLDCRTVAYHNIDLADD